MPTGYDDWKTTDTAGERAELIAERQREKAASWKNDKGNRKELRRILKELELLSDEFTGCTVYNDAEGLECDEILSAIAQLESILE